MWFHARNIILRICCTSTFKSPYTHINVIVYIILTSDIVLYTIKRHNSCLYQNINQQENNGFGNSTFSLPSLLYTPWYFPDSFDHSYHFPTRVSSSLPYYFSFNFQFTQYKTSVLFKIIILVYSSFQ